MAEVTIIGFPQSTYVRTVRMACEEKGVSYELEGRDFGSEELKAIHPFSKIPALKHGDVEVWETSAICRYIDDAFDGPALSPSSVAEKAMMEQWISAGNAYYDRDIVRAVVLERLGSPTLRLQHDPQGRVGIGTLVIECQSCAKICLRLHNQPLLSKHRPPHHQNVRIVGIFCVETT